jgi:hypothetical protein
MWKNKFSLLIIIQFLLCATINATSNCFLKVDTSTPDSCTSTQDKIELIRFEVIDKQLDSILLNTTKYIKKRTGICFYMTFVKRDSLIYFEIFEDYQNHYLFDIKKKKRHPLPNIDYMIYGFISYNDVPCYIVLYSGCFMPSTDDLNNFFYNSVDKRIITEEDGVLHFFYENPMWLYVFQNGNIKLIKSANDKGFFTNP